MKISKEQLKEIIKEETHKVIFEQAMTRQHFQLIADVLRNNKDADWSRLVFVFAKRLAMENPRFDESRFLLAAGVSGDTVAKMLGHKASGPE